MLPQLLILSDSGQSFELVLESALFSSSQNWCLTISDSILSILPSPKECTYDLMRIIKRYDLLDLIPSLFLSIPDRSLRGVC